MRELFRACWLPLLLFPNLITHAYCGELGDNNGNGASTSSVTTGAQDPTVTNTTPTVSASSSLTPTRVTATCPSRTVNYITHTLPQQCLRTDRVAVNATTDSASGNAQTTGTVNPGDAIVSSSSGSHPSTAAESVPTSTSSLATAASSSETPSPSFPDAELESDSPLDNANFLSFEEWKKQNLAKSGQSPENFGSGRNIEGIRERPINNALESFGDEGEIDLDFSGFGGEVSASRSSRRESHSQTTSVDAAAGELVPALRSKDAGKTCKERTNYASFDCAANVLKSNPECKSSSAVLVENKDSYMLNTCSAKNKFFIVELCDDILIDTIVLANYEFFSSMFRHFRVSVSDRYPVKIDKWKDLGTFEARNVRDVQAFLVERPQIWARYLRIEFLSHYGSEYYCPVSLLRVHGTTMLEDYRHQEELARGDHTEEATLDIEVNATPALAQEPIMSTDEASKETLTSIEVVDGAHEKAGMSTSVSPSDDAKQTRTSETVQTSPPRTSSFDLARELTSAVSELACPVEATTISANVTGKVDSRSETGATSASAASSTSAVTQRGGPSNSTEASTLSPPTSDPLPSAMNSTVESSGSASSSRSNGEGGNAPSSQISATDKTASAPAQPSSASSSPSASAPSSSTSSSTTNTTRQSSSSATIAAPPQPATQESFYKSVHKRLQQLESNSTLSLQYIEEQSRILRDAFSKVEKRQIAATSSFLTSLNSTVMAELQGFRQAYDQLWQSTVIELEGQREQYQREMLAMGSRLTLVADELVWQKRMGIVQSTLLLLCLGLVLFARQGNGYLEMPLMQQMVHRSQTALARAGWESPDASPSPMSRSPVSLFRRKLWRSHTEPASGNITDATDSRPESKDGPALEVNVAPPTPPREGDVGAVGTTDESEGVEADDDDDEAFEDVWESRSGPATPRGTREGAEFGQGVGWLDPGASGAAAEVG